MATYFPKLPGTGPTKSNDKSPPSPAGMSVTDSLKLEPIKSGSANMENIPPPAERMACVECRTLVLLSAVYLLVFQTIDFIWYFYNVELVFAGFSAIVPLLCSLIIINALTIRFAVLNAVLATMLTILTLSQFAYELFRLVVIYTSSDEQPDLNPALPLISSKCISPLNPPEYQCCIIAIVLVCGLAQTYRIDSYNEMLAFQKRHVIGETKHRKVAKVTIETPNEDKKKLGRPSQLAPANV